jgi:hypothetical protein
MLTLNIPSQAARAKAATLTPDEIRCTLAYLNAQPYTAKVAWLRAALTAELAVRSCLLCSGTGRMSDDVPCTHQHEGSAE